MVETSTQGLRGPETALQENSCLLTSFPTVGDVPHRCTPQINQPVLREHTVGLSPGYCGWRSKPTTFVSLLAVSLTHLCGIMQYFLRLKSLRQEVIHCCGWASQNQPQQCNKTFRCQFLEPPTMWTRPQLNGKNPLALSGIGWTLCSFLLSRQCLSRWNHQEQLVEGSMKCSKASW